MKSLRLTMIIVLFMLTITTTHCIPAYSQDSDTEFGKLFQQKYDAWVKARSAWNTVYPGYSGSPKIKKETDDLIALGSKAIPYFVSLFQEQLDKQTWDSSYQADMFCLIWVLTWKTFDRSGLPLLSPAYRAIVQRLYVDWWNTGRIQTPTNFASLFSQWDNFDKLSKKEDADKIVVKIINMGVEIMPMVMQKIQDGDERLVPWVKRIMRTRVEWKTADLTTVLEWWDKNQENLTFPPVVVEKPAEEPVKEPAK